MNEFIKFTLLLFWMLLTAVIIMSVIGGLVMKVTGFIDTWGKIPEELYPGAFKKDIHNKQ